MHTVTLNPDQNWYLDTSVTNHMTNITGNLSTYVNNSMLNNIIVSNWSQIRTLGTWHTTLKPLIHLSNFKIFLLHLTLLKTYYMFFVLQLITHFLLSLTCLAFLWRIFIPRFPSSDVTAPENSTRFLYLLLASQVYPPLLLSLKTSSTIAWDTQALLYCVF